MLADPVKTEIGDEERLRADLYGLLARLLCAPPTAEVIAAAAALEGDDTELGKAFAALADVARRTTPAAASDEYHQLFIGLGRGELLAHGSYYLTGFLNEKPLALLRADMAKLGIARADDNKVPEDHIATLCEMMSGLIVGEFGAPLDLKGQRAFFGTHIGPWANQFFTDLEGAEAAKFYGPVGRIGRIFTEIESVAFQMVG